MTSPDPGGLDALDQYLESLAAGDARPPAGLDPGLAATARDLRAMHGANDAAPDDLFVARLRENLLMTTPSNAYAGDTGVPRIVPPVTDRVRVVRGRARRVLDRRDDQRQGMPRPTMSAARPATPPTLIQRWNRTGWPVLELFAAAVLILGLVAALIQNMGPSSSDPTHTALVPGTQSNAIVAGTAGATPEAPTVPGIMSDGSPANDGVMPGPGVTSDPSVLWRVPMAQDAGVLVEHDGIAAWMQSAGKNFSGAKYEIRAIWTSNGAPAWQQPTNSWGFLAIDGDKLIVTLTGKQDYPRAIGDVQVGDANGSVIAQLDLKTGKLGWFASTETSVATSSIDDGIGYFATGDGTLQALDLSTGDQIWTQKLADPLDPSVMTGVLGMIAVSGERVVIYSPQDGKVFARDRRQGTELWTTQIVDPFVLGGHTDAGEHEIVSGPTISGNAVYVTRSSYQNGGRQQLLSIDLATGKTTWTTDLDPTVNGAPHPPFLPGIPRFGGGVVFLPSAVNGNVGVIAFDPASGKQVWTVDLGETDDILASVVGDTAYVAGPSGKLAALDLTNDGTVLWAVQTGGALRTPAFVDGGVVYQVSTDGYLYALTANGQATPATSGAPNISGQQTCDVTPVPRGEIHTTPYSTPEARATPAHSLTNNDGFVPGALAWTDLPTGTPADAETIAGIQETVDGVAACARVNDLGGVAAYFTSDYSLRPSSAQALWYSGYPMTSSEVPVMSRDVRVLPDGRVAMVVTEGLQSNNLQGTEGRLYVFAQQPDGRWLIDEVIVLNDDGKPRQG